MISNPNARKWVYIGNQAIGLVLLILSALSIIDEGTAANIEGAVGSVVMLLVGELARRNISPAPAVIGPDGVARFTDAGAVQRRPADRVFIDSVDQVGTSIVNAIGSPDLRKNLAGEIEQVLHAKDCPPPPRGGSGQSDAVEMMRYSGSGELTRAEIERRLTGR